MRELLTSLGWGTGVAERVWLVSLIVITTIFWIGAKHFLYVITAIDPRYVHLIGWSFWFTWHGHFFSKARERFLTATPATAYRNAFYRHIVPGASFALSQAMSPLFYGCLLPDVPIRPLAEVATGMLSVCVGTVLVCLGFYTIGIAAAGFIYEYRHDPPPLITHGIYKWIRHPIYLGGILASFGTSLPFSDNRLVLALGLLNIVTIPLYWSIEDARLTRIFGLRYVRYRSSAKLAQHSGGASRQQHTRVP
jgi:protein-S-isoprenylcysteine O-methyltransferase Ste14